MKQRHAVGRGERDAVGADRQASRIEPGSMSVRRCSPQTGAASLKKLRLDALLNTGPHAVCATIRAPASHDPPSG